MKNTIITTLLFLLLFVSKSEAQNKLTLDSCYSLASKNYPLNKEFININEKKLKALENADKAYLPQVNVGGQATYQSDVTMLPISLPGINIPSPSKDQYKVFTEINQPITDLLTIKPQKELIQKNAVLETNKLEVELYKLKEQLAQLYFGILLLDEQIEQLELLVKDIQTGIDRVQTAIDAGIGLKTNLYSLQAEMLKVKQKQLELQIAKKTTIDMLGLYLGIALDETTLLEMPELNILPTEIKRPEIALFESQKMLLETQKKLTDLKNIPRLSFFVQGGYGRPALNMLSNDFNFYYLGGLRLNWNLNGLYTLKNEKEIIGLGARSIDLQKEAFLFNLSLALKQKNSEILKMESLIASDEEIILLREKAKQIGQTQLENGTATANDYILLANAEAQARQNLGIHKIQLIMNRHFYELSAGK
jgi:outer membrane protein TolC